MKLLVSLRRGLMRLLRRPQVPEEGLIAWRISMLEVALEAVDRLQTAALRYVDRQSPHRLRAFHRAFEEARHECVIIPDPAIEPALDAVYHSRRVLNPLELTAEYRDDFRTELERAFDAGCDALIARLRELGA